MEDAYIYDALRTVRGKGRKDGALHEVTSVKLSADILNAVKNRNGIEGHALEDVIWGNANKGPIGCRRCPSAAVTMADQVRDRTARRRRITIRRHAPCHRSTRTGSVSCHLISPARTKAFGPRIF